MSAKTSSDQSPTEAAVADVAIRDRLAELTYSSTNGLLRDIK
ncbi:hypothetical protein OG426_55120 (plasmid) [Streptomyces canus]|nr:hypothetical protein OG426_55120 [Streptomyces canus]